MRCWVCRESFVRTPKGLFIAGLVAAALFIFQSPSLQPALIILGGLLGAGLFRQESSESSLTPKQKPKHPVTALAVLLCFISAVVILSSLRPNTDEMTTVIGLAKQGRSFKVAAMSCCPY